MCFWPFINYLQLAVAQLMGARAGPSAMAGAGRDNWPSLTHASTSEVRRLKYALLSEAQRCMGESTSAYSCSCMSCQCRLVGERRVANHRTWPHDHDHGGPGLPRRWRHTADIPIGAAIEEGRDYLQQSWLGRDFPGIGTPLHHGLGVQMFGGGVAELLIPG